jgi:hypothetical protein
MPKIHFMIADRKSWIALEEHPPSEIGVREGELYEDDPKGALERVKVAEEFFREGKRVSKPDWEKDPAIYMLRHLIDWEVETDSSKLSEEFSV